MKPRVTMRQALADPALLGTVLAGSSWRGWRVLLIAAMGEKLTKQERVVFKQLTGREHEPGQCVEELVCIIGRRGGKTRAAATAAAYLAALCDHGGLSPGERGRVMFLAANQKQAAVAFAYTAAIFDAVPTLSDLVTGRTADTLSLATGVDLEIRAASSRGLRGVTAVAVVADECAFWVVDEMSANADVEILNAVRPALATTGGPLIVTSSPYARRGEVYNTFRAHYGPQGDPRILVAQGASRDLNPKLPQTVIDRAMERDPASASSEYLALFREDTAAFISRAAVEACVPPGRYELPRMSGVSYFAFVDPSGGSADSMTMAVAHFDRATDRAVLDVVRERRPPFSPDGVAEQFSMLARTYGVGRVTGDRYSGEWVRERFKQHGVAYEVSERTKSEIYGEVLPLLNSGRVELLDHPRLVSQLIGLERRVARSGKDSIDHSPGGHDDVCNAAAGALVGVLMSAPAFIITPEMVAQIRSFRGRSRHQRWGAA